MKIIDKINEIVFRYKVYPELRKTIDKQEENKIKLLKKLLRINEKLDELEKQQKENEQETYWNNKRQKKFITWKARDGVKMDVRCFFQTDYTLPRFKGSADEIAKRALNYVINRLKYRSDNGERWNYAYETLKNKYGDCEDGAILIANLMLNSKIPYWKIRLNKGWVRYKGKKSYHCWCSYLAEDNEWRTMDWCYHFKKCINLNLKWKDSEDYLFVDSSWNSKFSYSGLKK